MFVASVKILQFRTAIDFSPIKKLLSTNTNRLHMLTWDNTVREQWLSLLIRCYHFCISFQKKRCFYRLYANFSLLFRCSLLPFSWDIPNLLLSRNVCIYVVTIEISVICAFLVEYLCFFSGRMSLNISREQRLIVMISLEAFTIKAKILLKNSMLCSLRFRRRLGNWD